MAVVRGGVKAAAAVVPGRFKQCPGLRIGHCLKEIAQGGATQAQRGAIGAGLEPFRPLFGVGHAGCVAIDMSVVAGDFSTHRPWSPMRVIPGLWPSGY